MQIQPTPSEKFYWHGRTVTEALLGESWSHDLFCKMCQTCYKKPQQSSPCCSVWNRVFSSCCAGFSYLMCSCRCQRAVLRADAFFILLHEQRHFPAAWEKEKLSICLWCCLSLLCLDQFRFITSAVHRLRNSFVFYRDTTAVRAPWGAGHDLPHGGQERAVQWQTSFTKQNGTAKLSQGGKQKHGNRNRFADDLAWIHKIIE